MRQTIKDLWNGRINPYQNCGTGDPEIRHLMELMERHRDAVMKISGREQQELFEKYMDCAGEYSRLMQEAAFIEGFLLAGRLAAECRS